jgi:hypothetical protein
MPFPREYFKASRWTKKNHLFPAELEVSPAGVTRYKRSFFGQDVIEIGMAKIASVHIVTGPIFATILIESTGGTDPLCSNGHQKEDAKRIKQLIEQGQALLARGNQAEAEIDPADQKECPFCAEVIKAKASICRFCNREQPA